VHIPDGFLDAPTSTATAAVAAIAVAVCVRRARHELDERTAPMAGLVAAFIFAVQMLNFPIGAGTSGHLLGGALAAVLVGPFTGALCVSVVLVMQALLFADGGLTALGSNISLMSVVTVVVGYGVFAALLRVLPRGRPSIVVASFVGAALSVPAAAVAFVGLYSVGGTADLDLSTLTTAMAAVHLLIGVGEGLITAATVSSVLAVRPDLVRGARGMLPAPQLADRPAATAPATSGDVR
jgi:cobalt/nickel transport system permease protein